MRVNVNGQLVVVGKSTIGWGKLSQAKNNQTGLHAYMHKIIDQLLAGNWMKVGS